MASEASHALEAALEQMDGIIAGTKTSADISDGTCEPGLTSPASYTNPFPVLHLVEDLRLALETLEHPQEREALLSQIPGPTAAYIKEWFEERLSQVNHHSAASNETYQERLARLEGDKESLILQVSSFWWESCCLQLYSCSKWERSTGIFSVGFILRPKCMVFRKTFPETKQKVTGGTV